MSFSEVSFRVCNARLARSILARKGCKDNQDKVQLEAVAHYFMAELWQ